MNSIFHRNLTFLIPTLILLACQPENKVVTYPDIPISLDQEINLDSTKALNAGTQSLNRYYSVIRDLDKLSVEYNSTEKRINLLLGKQEADPKLMFYNLDTKFLVPLLPYSHKAILDDFDKANLLLAEYARNGINLSYQNANDKFAYFNTPHDLFNDDAEFIYTTAGEIKPNTAIRPKRMSVVNNCLNPCLWEINASDAVGEMYHGWLTLPDELYFSMVKDHNNIDNEAEELKNFINNTASFENIVLDLNRFRKQKKLIHQSTAQVASDKILDGYSTQDSRRKVQRGFYKIMRDSQQLALRTFGDLQAGDVFDMHSFKQPGIYDNKERTKVPYNPNWNHAELYDVTPLTSYGGLHDAYGKYGYIEVQLHDSLQNQSFIVGNIPVQLLVFSEDYKIPAFGAGVLASSELVERRYLRLEEGPYPHYAYMAKQDKDALYLLNNHPIGYEQVYLRPFQKEGKIYLRFTVVSYERIVDLLEFNIPLEGTLAERIQKASAEYKPPIYEVYTDTNIL